MTATRAATRGALNFKDESKKLAQAMGDEHGAVGDWLDDTTSPDLLSELRNAHKAVEFQRARTDAARGQRAE